MLTRKQQEKKIDLLEQRVSQMENHMDEFIGSVLQQQLSPYMERLSKLFVQIESILTSEQKQQLDEWLKDEQDTERDSEGA